LGLLIYGTLFLLLTLQPVPPVAAPAPTAVPATPAAAPAVDPNTEPEQMVETVEDHIEVSASRHHRIDPLHKVNQASFDMAQSVDTAFVGPAAQGFERIVPEPVRDGLRNAINNLQSPIIFTNFLLQHRIGKAAQTLGRFVINSSIGVFGLFDFAKRKPFQWPRRRNGFGNTLGFYGVRPGPYLFLPLIGPTNLRDMLGGLLDTSVLPLAVGGPLTNPAYMLPTAATRGLDRRDLLDEELAEVRKAHDPYVARRFAYLKRRQLEIDALHEQRPRPPEPARP
jgi:phospholipid-binding lipoprotein MlaA